MCSVELDETASVEAAQAGLHYVLLSVLSSQVGLFDFGVNTLRNSSVYVLN